MRRFNRKNEYQSPLARYLADPDKSLAERLQEHHEKMYQEAQERQRQQKEAAEKRKSERQEKELQKLMAQAEKGAAEAIEKAIYSMWKK